MTSPTEERLHTYRRRLHTLAAAIEDRAWPDSALRRWEAAPVVELVDELDSCLAAGAADPQDGTVATPRQAERLRERLTFVLWMLRRRRTYAGGPADQALAHVQHDLFTGVESLDLYLDPERDYRRGLFGLHPETWEVLGLWPLTILVMAGGSLVAALAPGAWQWGGLIVALAATGGFFFACVALPREIRKDLNDACGRIPSYVRRIALATAPLTGGPGVDSLDAGAEPAVGPRT